MESLYRLPFEKFDRYSPRGTPEDVATALAPFVEAGCRTFNLIPAGDDLVARSSTPPPRSAGCSTQ